MPVSVAVGPLPQGGARAEAESSEDEFYSGDAGSGGAANSRGSLRRTRGRHLGWIADSAAIRLTAMMPRSALVEADGKREKEQNSRATVHRQWR